MGRGRLHATITEALIKAVNSTTAVKYLLFTRIKRMALRTDIDEDIFPGR